MKKLDAGTRIGTMIVDHFIMTFVMVIVTMPGVVYDVIQTFGNSNAQPKLFLGNLYLNILAFSLYFNKDIYFGRSPAKRIFKLQVVDVKTNRPANPLKCLVRNITVILWPIEVVAAMINNERRIGDFIAGTKLTAYDPDQHNNHDTNWVLMIIALLAGMLVTYFVVVYPIELWTKGSGLAASI